jgi:hypothetical protein
MGVAQYELSPTLPRQLQQDLPTVEEFAREFPLISAVELWIEIERALREFMSDNDLLPSARPASAICCANFIGVVPRLPVLSGLSNPSGS